MGWVDRIPFAVLPEGRDGGGDVVCDAGSDPEAFVLVVVSGSSSTRHSGGRQCAPCQMYRVYDCAQKWRAWHGGLALCWG